MVHPRTSARGGGAALKDDKLYLIHIRECIERIERYTADGREAFFTDGKTQDAVLRNLQTLAESARRLGDAIKATRPEIAWKSITGFRNVAVHDYLGIDLQRVWDIIERDSPPLQRAVESILAALEAKS